jgi:hypothetical protein
MTLKVCQDIADLRETDSRETSLTGGCVRCGGYMTTGRYIDLQDDTGQIEFEAERCVQCGDVVDPIIRRNRAQQRMIREQMQNTLPEWTRRVA